MLRREPYAKVSFSQMISALKWVQNTLNLRDWEINLNYGEEEPNWIDPNRKFYGGIINLTYVGSFYAEIWISPEECKNNFSHPISVLFHEIIHLLLESYNQNTDYLHFNERLINTLEYHLFKSWKCRGKLNVSEKR